MNRWHKAYQKARLNPEFADLTLTSFHEAGWMHTPEVLTPLWEEYLLQRSYNPQPKGALEARCAVASFYTQAGMEGVSPEDIFLTASTSEAYVLLFHLLGGPGAKLLFPRPGYPLFDHLAVFSRSEPDYYTLEGPDWRLTKAGLEAGWKAGCRALVMVSPHNPTGRIFTPEEIHLALEFCREKKMALIWDEVFDPWNFTPRPFPRPWQSDPEVPVMILNGISKRFASPDLKLGWILFQGPKDWKRRFTENLEVANDTLLGANSFSQFMLPTLFSSSQDLLKSLIEKASLNRQRVVQELQPWAGAGPDGGLYAVLNVPASPWDDESLAIRLLSQGVGVHPGYFYDLDGQHLVLSLTADPSSFDRRVKVLASALKKEG